MLVAIKCNSDEKLMVHCNLRILPPVSSRPHIIPHIMFLLFLQNSTERNITWSRVGGWNEGKFYTENEDDMETFFKVVKVIFLKFKDLEMTKSNPWISKGLYQTVLPTPLIPTDPHSPPTTPTHPHRTLLI